MEGRPKEGGLGQNRHGSGGLLILDSNEQQVGSRSYSEVWRLSERVKRGRRRNSTAVPQIFQESHRDLQGKRALKLHHQNAHARLMLGQQKKA